MWPWKILAYVTSPASPSAGSAGKSGRFRGRPRRREPLEIASLPRSGRAGAAQPLHHHAHAGHDEELAVGFLLSRGSSRTGAICARCAASGRGAVQPGPGRAPGPRRRGSARHGAHFYTTSSCGVCGKASIARSGPCGAIRPPRKGRRPSCRPACCTGCRAAARRPGGFAATAACTPPPWWTGRAGGPAARGCRPAQRPGQAHRQALLEDCCPARHLLLVSGRASFELVQKAAMPGCPSSARSARPRASRWTGREAG